MAVIVDFNIVANRNTGIPPNTTAVLFLGEEGVQSVGTSVGP